MLATVVGVAFLLIGIMELLRWNTRNHRRLVRERLLQTIRDIRDEEKIRGKPSRAVAAHARRVRG